MPRQDDGVPQGKQGKDAGIAAVRFGRGNAVVWGLPAVFAWRHLRFRPLSPRVLPNGRPSKTASVRMRAAGRKRRIRGGAVRACLLSASLPKKCRAGLPQQLSGMGAGKKRALLVVSPPMKRGSNGGRLEGLVSSKRFD